MLRMQFVNDFVLLEDLCRRDCTCCNLQKSKLDLSIPKTSSDGDRAVLLDHATG